MMSQNGFAGRAADGEAAVSAVGRPVGRLDNIRWGVKRYDCQNNGGREEGSIGDPEGGRENWLAIK